MNITARIEAIVAHFGTKTQFANATGLSLSLVSRAVNGASVPKFENVEAIYRAVKGLNPHWVLTGEGAMMVDESAGLDIAAEPSVTYGQSELDKCRLEVSYLNRLLAEKDHLIRILSAQLNVQ